MADTDVRVRLTAEGLKDVIDALRKLKSEGDKVGASAKGLGLFSNGLSSIKSLLPALGVGVSVAGIVSIGKSALDSADDLGALQEKIGASAETLSVLRFQASQADTDFDTLSKGLVKLARTQDDAASGNQKAIDFFTRLNISIDDVKKSDPASLFVKVGQSFGKIEDGAAKAGIAADGFGKSGAELIPLLNSLADDGFEQARAKAEALGVVLSDDSVQAMKAMKDQMEALELQAQGLAAQFLTGLAPAINKTMEDISGATANKGGSAMKTFGRIAGAVIQLVSSGFITMGAVIGHVFFEIGEQFRVFSDGIDAFKKGGIKGLLDADKELTANHNARLAAGRAATKETFETQRKLLFDAFGNIADGRLETAQSTTGNGNGRGHHGGGTEGFNSDNARAVANARKAFLQAQADNELALINARNKLEEGQNDRAYKAGLVSLAEYYDKRRQLIDSQSQAELANLQSKLSAAQAAPAKDAAEQIKKQQEIAKIKAEIQQKELEHENELGALQADRQDAERQHSLDVLAARERIAQIMGDAAQAQQLALEQELASLDEMLKKAGIAADERQKQIDAARSKGQASIDFNAAATQGSGILDSIALEKERLSNEVDAGRLGGFAAEQKLLDVQRERLPVLREIVAQMKQLAEASGDISLQKQADEFEIAVGRIDASVNHTINVMEELKQAAFEGGVSALTDFFQRGIKEANNFGDAVKGMAASVASALADMLAQMLAFQAMKSIFGAFGLPVPAGGFGHADGGHITGPGTSRSDSIPAMLSNGEFVTRAAVVGQPGALEFLHAFNNEGMGALRRFGARGYADGGLVAGAATGGNMDASLTVGLDDGLIMKAMESPAFGRVLVRHLGQNRRAARAAIGG